MMRCTISQLLIFCITPFAFNALSCSSPYYGTSIDTDIISTEEPHDTRTVSFAYNTICTIEHDFIGGFASTNPPCPLHKLRVHMDKGKTYSLTVLQQEWMPVCPSMATFGRSRGNRKRSCGNTGKLCTYLEVLRGTCGMYFQWGLRATSVKIRKDAKIHTFNGDSKLVVSYWIPT